MERTELNVGSARIAMLDARRWISRYFDESANRESTKPYAYPAYDKLDTGSGPNTLNDGDLLAPTLLNARPSIAAFFSLARVRDPLESALVAVTPDVTLQEVVASARTSELLAPMVSVLDDFSLHGVRLTTLSKVLHRKRPMLVPLYDRFVKACYVGKAADHPVKSHGGGRTDQYFVRVATAICHDLDSQPDAFAELSALAPGVEKLRLLDVLAWQAGRLV